MVMVLFLEMGIIFLLLWSLSWKGGKKSLREKKEMPGRLVAGGKNKV